MNTNDRIRSIMRGPDLEAIDRRRGRAMGALLNAARALPDGEIRSGCVIDTRDAILGAIRGTIVDDCGALIAEVRRLHALLLQE